MEIKKLFSYFLLTSDELLTTVEINVINTIANNFHVARLKSCNSFEAINPIRYVVLTFTL